MSKRARQLADVSIDDELRRCVDLFLHDLSADDPTKCISNAGFGRLARTPPFRQAERKRGEEIAAAVALIDLEIVEQFAGIDEIRHLRHSLEDVTQTGR